MLESGLGGLGSNLPEGVTDKKLLQTVLSHFQAER